MPLEITCPVCCHALAVPDQYVGKNWRCPDCRTAFVPTPGARAPAAPRPPSRWSAAVVAAVAALVVIGVAVIAALRAAHKL